MKNKTTLIILAIFLGIIFSNLASAEVHLYNTVFVDNSSQTVTLHGYYWFEDTSADGTGKYQASPILLWSNVEILPYNFTQFDPTLLGEVDYCNWTITHDSNTFDTNGNIINTTTYQNSYYYDYTSSTQTPSSWWDFIKSLFGTTSPYTSNNVSENQFVVYMKNRDVMTSDMVCHYTDPSSLYVQNTLIGRFSAYMSSYSCNSCTKYSLEELSNMNENADNITTSQLEIYGNIQTAIDWNFQIWIIVSYIFKIGFLLVGVFLVFAGAYWFYKFIEGLARE